MTKTERLFRLMQLLRQLPPPVTAEQLAQELDVSARTIHRDIDALRALGAMIDGAAGFGFTLIEDATLPPLGFGATELEALSLGLSEVAHRGDPDLAEAARSALKKLHARLPPRQSARLQHATLSAFMFSPPAPPTVDSAVLRQATWEEREVCFSYSDGKGTVTKRQVKPLEMIYFDQSTVLIAWCHLRRGFRVFRLDRMQALEVRETTFRPHRVRLYREALAHLRSQKIG
ncbi:YafY family protein [Phaeobacter sp. HF9A]|uniref:helix-turn-helix transcriptional regulator n=1 Tax=Phaeobacter sp. HF9A TaxID=2721561 RepID=UPI00142F60EC|nr:YafY family protein [Phaeobacter sp. HF9A]NIZ13271.1 YafY family transcriptional regulator [Phaeobacter sp. HF9A]